MQVPVLKSGDILIVPIHGAMTDQEAIQLQEEILDAVSATTAKGMILDITALETVDSFIARMLSETSEMVELMGTKSIIAGMSPPVAVTLVEMGRTSVGLETALNLEKGLIRLRQLIKEKSALVTSDAGEGYEDAESNNA